MEENRDRSTVVDPSLAQLANRIDRKPSSSELRENRLSRPLVVLLAKLLLLLHLLDEGLIAGILFQLRHELGRCPRPTFRPPTGHGKYLRKTCLAAIASCSGPDNTHSPRRGWCSCSPDSRLRPTRPPTCQSSKCFGCRSCRPAPPACRPAPHRRCGPTTSRHRSTPSPACGWSARPAGCSRRWWRCPAGRWSF